MIDEHQEELAALHALDLLEGAERTQFEAALASDPALQALVRALREGSAELAHTAPAMPPPAALRSRILTSVTPERGNVVHPPASLFRPLLGWGLAASFALLAAVLGQLYLSSRTESSLRGHEVALANAALQAAHNQLEAERLLNGRQISDLGQQVAELRRDGDLANLKVAALASLLKDQPTALAVAVWNPATQDGFITLENAPPLSTGQRLELWTVEDKAGAVPVSAGKLTPDASGKFRAPFKPGAPVSVLKAVAISRENDDGVRAHAKPDQVIMMGPTL